MNKKFQNEINKNYFYFCFVEPYSYNENKIIVKINNDIITSIDLLNEINYLKALDKNFGILKKRNYSNS